MPVVPCPEISNTSLANGCIVHRPCTIGDNCFIDLADCMESKSITKAAKV